MKYGVRLYQDLRAQSDIHPSREHGFSLAEIEDLR